MAITQLATGPALRELRVVAFADALVDRARTLLLDRARTLLLDRARTLLLAGHAVALVADELDVSERYLRPAFVDRTGLSPKRYARIARLQRVLARLRGRRGRGSPASWAFSIRPTSSTNSATSRARRPTPSRRRARAEELHRH